MSFRLGVLTSGGDCAGLNAAIRAVGKAANALGIEVIGFLDGFRCLVENPPIHLQNANLSGILTLGGTILGTVPETPLVTHRVMAPPGVSGTLSWLAPAGDASAWASTVETILAQPVDLPTLRSGARLEFEQHYTAEAGYARWAAGVAPLLPDGMARL